MENEKKFDLFSRFRSKKEITEEEDRTPTLKFFFKLLWRKARGLITLNFMMLFMVLPIVIGVFLYITAPTTPTTLSPIYAPVYGTSMISDSAAVNTILSTVNQQLGLPVLSVSRSWILIGLGVFLALTWGFQNVGSSYVLRGFFRGDAVFPFSDYFYAVRRNWKQAIGMGILDFGVLAILIIDYISMYQQTGTYWNDIMYFMIFAIAIIYFFMRFYIYQLMITFEMKWTKILKNSFIFALLGIKRNIMAGLGILLIVALNLLLIVLLLPIATVPILLPFFYLFSFTAFMAVYAAYPIIDRYLIKPYETAHPQTHNDDEDSLFGNFEEENESESPSEE